MKDKIIFILKGKDRGKYAKVIKVLDDENLSVRLEKGVKIIVEKDNYVVI